MAIVRRCRACPRCGRGSKRRRSRPGNPAGEHTRKVAGYDPARRSLAIRLFGVDADLDSGASAADSPFITGTVIAPDVTYMPPLEGIASLIRSETMSRMLERRSSTQATLHPGTVGTVLGLRGTPRVRRELGPAVAGCQRCGHGTDAVFSRLAEPGTHRSNGPGAESIIPIVNPGGLRAVAVVWPDDPWDANGHSRIRRQGIGTIHGVSRRPDCCR
jgi:hypothetical protein